MASRPLIDTFLPSHPGWLEQAEATWDEDVAWAQAHGYDPTDAEYDQSETSWRGRVRAADGCAGRRTTQPVVEAAGRGGRTEQAAAAPPQAPGIRRRGRET